MVGRQVGTTWWRQRSREVIGSGGRVERGRHKSFICDRRGGCGG